MRMVGRFLFGSVFALVLALAAGTAMADTSRYSDSATIPAWAQADVELTSTFRVFRGDASGTFRPESAISRAEFTAILMRAFSLNPNPAVEVPFSDIAGGWYTDVIVKAVQTGVIQSGDFPSEFNPNGAITRAEMARMVARAVDARRVVFIPGEVRTFSDVSASHPFAEAIRKATSYGIINGMPDGTFLPENTATRAQAAVMIARAMRLGAPQEPDAKPNIHRSVRMGPQNVFFGGFELAAVRRTGETLDLSLIAQWLAPDALEKWATILNRDVRPGTPGSTWWWEGPITYIGEDHAFAEGELAGNDGTIRLPMQRQFDGRWTIMDIPFDGLSISGLLPSRTNNVTFQYSNTSGTYFDVQSSPGGVPNVLTKLEQRGWADGQLRILRAAGQDWRLTEYSPDVSAFHARVDASRSTPKHIYTSQQVEGMKVETFADDLEFVAAVAWLYERDSIVYSIDGVPWGLISEDVFFRDLVNSLPPTGGGSLELVVRRDPNRWVSQFLQLLDRVRGQSIASR